MSDWTTAEKSATRLTEAARNGLIDDLFRRYEDAFGGKQQFVAALLAYLHGDVTKNNYTFGLSSEMRRRVLLLATEVGKEQDLTYEMTDPAFGGLGYDGREVHFESAPASVGELCPALRGRNLWLYAFFKNEDAAYYYVSDWIIADNAPPLVIIRGTGCKVDTSDWTNPERSASVLGDIARRGLFTDLLRRHAAAFGSKAAFLRALHPSTTSRAYFSSAVLDIYQRFVKDP